MTPKPRDGWAVVKNCEIKYATETNFVDKEQAESVLLKHLTRPGYTVIPVRITPIGEDE